MILEFRRHPFPQCDETGYRFIAAEDAGRILLRVISTGNHVQVDDHFDAVLLPEIEYFGNDVFNLVIHRPVVEFRLVPGPVCGNVELEPQQIDVPLLQYPEILLVGLIVDRADHSPVDRPRLHCIGVLALVPDVAFLETGDDAEGGEVVAELA